MFSQILGAQLHDHLNEVCRTYTVGDMTHMISASYVNAKYFEGDECCGENKTLNYLRRGHVLTGHQNYRNIKRKIIIDFSCT